MSEGPLTARGRWLRLLNYALVCAVVGMALQQFLARVEALQADAERYAFERNYTALRHAVYLRGVRALAEGGPDRLLPLIGANAIEWADWQNAGSSGQGTAVEASAEASSAWHYQAPSGLICCSRTGNAETPQRCYRVEADFADLDGDQQLDWPREQPIGLRLQPVPESML